MQHQQVFIAGDQNIRFSRQDRSEKHCISGIAAGRIDSHEVGVLHCEQMDISLNQRDELLARGPIQIMVELLPPKPMSPRWHKHPMHLV